MVPPLSSKERNIIEHFSPYSFHPATKDQLASFPHTYISEYRGASGPIYTTPPSHIPSLEILFQETMINKGLNFNRDPYGGDVCIAHPS